MFVGSDNGDSFTKCHFRVFKCLEIIVTDHIFMENPRSEYIENILFKHADIVSISLFTMFSAVPNIMSLDSERENIMSPMYISSIAIVTYLYHLNSLVTGMIGVLVGPGLGRTDLPFMHAKLYPNISFSIRMFSVVTEKFLSCCFLPYG